MSFLNKAVDKITSGPQAQYILGGALVVIILLSSGSLFWSMYHKDRPNVPSEWYGYCLETHQKFEIDPNDRSPENDFPQSDGLIYSPFTKERTAVAMTSCPNCKEWFVPERLKDALERANSGEPFSPMDMESDLTCPNCGTNIVQWYREHRKRR